MSLKKPEQAQRSENPRYTSREMAAIRALKGLRFSTEAGALESLVAPPYDVLSPAQRDDYAARNPHNIVHLTLPEQKPDDRSKYVKYARSAALLSEWRRDGALLVEPRPAIYRYIQKFAIPGTRETFTRTSILALIKVEPYEKGIVLPHEQTFPKHKEDRLRILEATRSHLESIFGLYEDPEGKVLAAIERAPAETRVRTASEGIEHVLEPICDPEAVSMLVQLMADKKVWIADGHHRYETALAFREALGPKEGLVPEDFMMMALSSMSDPGLVLLPTHRIVSAMPLARSEAVAKLSEVFELQETHSSRLMDRIAQLHEQGKRAFGVAFEGGIGYVLTPKDEAALVASVEGDASHALKALDVTILHSVILERLLGLKGLESISYTRDPLDAVRQADMGAAAAFLMNPPSVDDMKEIALGGEKMPQKSTYYYPKIQSGLVLWSLNDFEQ